jgi:predicted ATP-dependent endonuclease of OLD family
MNHIERIIFKDTIISLRSRHLILTGNNGSGKTYFLNQLRSLLKNNNVNDLSDTTKEDKEKLIDFLKYTIEIFKDPLKLDQDDINLIKNITNNINFTSSIKKINISFESKYKVFLNEKEIFFKDNPKLTQQEFMIHAIHNSKIKKYFYYYSPEYVENIIKKIDFHIQNILKKKKQIEIFTTNKTSIDFTFFDSARVPSNEGMQLKVFQSYENLKHNSRQIDPPNLLEAYLIYIRKQIDELLDNRNISQGHNIYGINKIQKWFIKVEKDLKYIFENDSIELSFSKNGDEVLINAKTINQNYTFDQLSSGFKAIFYIYSALLMKAESENIAVEEISDIVIIDEIDVHLHISLQKKVLPFLIKSFPKIQFIVSTHSPFVITSTNNDTVVYDISSGEFLEDDLSQYSYESVIRGLFHVNPMSLETNVTVENLKNLLNSNPINYENIRSIIKGLAPLEKNDVLDKKVKNLYLQAINLLLDNNQLGDLDV